MRMGFTGSAQRFSASQPAGLEEEVLEMTATDQVCEPPVDFTREVVEFTERWDEFLGTSAEELIERSIDPREHLREFITGVFVKFSRQPAEFREQWDEYHEQRATEEGIEEDMEWIEHTPWFQEWLATCHPPEAQAAARNARAEIIGEQADAILRLLERRSITLFRGQEAALRKKSAKQILPLYALALTVERASEFARKARLNGRGTSRASSRKHGRSGRNSGKGRAQADGRGR